MPPKKKDAIIANLRKHDREIFLQAFEKPTQIYRYLRTRNVISPIFLHRNLTYMQGRSARKDKKKRKEFNVNLLLINALLHRPTIYEHGDTRVFHYDFLTLKFFGYFDKHIFEEESAKVEIYSLNTLQMKRDHMAAGEVFLGSTVVKINPIGTTDSMPVIQIPVQSIRPAITTASSQHQSSNLLIKLFVLRHDADIKDEPIINKSKYVTEYHEELVVFDKKNHCNLSDGEYELMLREKSNSSTIKSKQNEPTWEDMPSYFVESDTSFNQSPSLKFLLSWSDDNCLSKYVEYCNDDEIEQNSNCIETNSDEDIKDNIVIKTNNDSNNNSRVTNNSSNNDDSEDVMNISIKNNESSGDSCSHDNAGNSDDVNTSYINLNNINSAGMQSATSRVIYRFIYNNDLSQQTETSDNFNCPWCNLNCMQLYSLLKHLKLCHSRFNFKYTPTERCVCIDVSINELFDGSRHDPLALSRDLPARRITETHILVCHPKRVKQSLSEFEKTINDDDADMFEDENGVYTSGHHRLYYHSQTCLPLTSKEFNDDSEEEIDPVWLRDKTKLMLDDFTDVNEGEKAIMKMWNLHVMHNNFLADKQIPAACFSFVEVYGAEIIEKNLYRNFLLHMCNLVDHGLITNDIFYKLVQKIQHMFTSTGGEVTSRAHDARIDYWTKYGKNKHK